MGLSGPKWFPFEYEQSKRIFIPPTPGVSRICADGVEVPESSRDEIRTIYQEEFADRGMSIDFSEWV